MNTQHQSSSSPAHTQRTAAELFLGEEEEEEVEKSPSPLLLPSQQTLPTHRERDHGC